MHFTRILLSIVFVLFASTALAAKPEKTLVCHVGNEVGPGGEVYLDDPGCVPIEENEYFCPDAGKIDLIEVAKANKHLNNQSHEYDGISDYLPEEVDASGEGKEDSNGDGIDDGCEPPPACPCADMWATASQGWNAFIQSPLVPLYLAGDLLPDALGYLTWPEEDIVAGCIFFERGPGTAATDFAGVRFFVDQPFEQPTVAPSCSARVQAPLPFTAGVDESVAELTIEQTAACVVELQSMCQ